jgi:DNA-binding transcriptional ArsR family regulator
MSMACRIAGITSRNITVTSNPAVIGKVIQAMQINSPTTQIDRVFQALGDASRRAILDELSKGPVSVSHLAKPLKITLAAVVQHINVLELSGLVKTEKVGRVRTCQMVPENLSLAEHWLSQRRGLWERRFDRLGELLAEDGD